MRTSGREPQLGSAKMCIHPLRLPIILLRRGMDWGSPSVPCMVLVPLSFSHTTLHLTRKISLRYFNLFTPSYKSYVQVPVLTSKKASIKLKNKSGCSFQPTIMHVYIGTKYYVIRFCVHYETAAGFISRC